jgi:hypothetical protein
VSKIKEEVVAPSSGLPDCELKETSISRRDKEETPVINNNVEEDKDDNDEDVEDIDGKLIPPDEIRANYPFEYPESLFSEDEDGKLYIFESECIANFP